MPRRWLPGLLSIACAAPAFGQGGPGAGGYCFSDPSEPVVYFSAIFDTKLNPRVGNNAGPIGREFHAYIKARFGFTTNSNYPVSCGFHDSPGAAEANRAVAESRVREQKGKVVELDWKYLPDTAAATVSFDRPPGERNPPPAPQADYGFCLAGPFQGPLYVSDVFDAVAPVSIAQWNVAWLRYLGGKYGYKGTIQCENGTLNESRRVLKAYSDGARTAGRNIIEAGWKYDAAANTTPAVQKYCLQDRAVSVVFDCIKVRRAVYAYRLAHPTGTP